MNNIEYKVAAVDQNKIKERNVLNLWVHYVLKHLSCIFKPYSLPKLEGNINFLIEETSKTNSLTLKKLELQQHQW